MTNVTVEGSSHPCVQLPKGERRTYVLTPSVQRKIDKGYFLEIERWEPGQEKAPAPAPVVVEEPAPVAVEEPTPVIEEAVLDETVDIVAEPETTDKPKSSRSKR